MGHHRGDDDVLHRLRRQVEAPEILTGKQPDLVRGAVRVGFQPKGPQKLRSFIDAETDVGVAHVDCQ